MKKVLLPLVFILLLPWASSAPQGIGDIAAMKTPAEPYFSIKKFNRLTLLSLTKRSKRGMPPGPHQLQCSLGYQTPHHKA